MEGSLAVRAGRTECEKVLSSLWDGFAEYFELDVTVGSVELQLACQLEHMCKNEKHGVYRD